MVLDTFKTLFDEKKITGVSPTGTTYGFVIDEKGLEVYYAVLADGKTPKGSIRKVNLKKFITKNRSMPAVEIGKDDALSTSPESGNKTIIDEINRIKGLAAERDKEREKNMTEREKLINQFAKRFVDVKLDDKKDQNAWKQDILNSLKDGSRWHIEQHHTSGQEEAILALNKQFINWAVEDATKTKVNFRGEEKTISLFGVEQHEAVVRILAEEMVKAFVGSGFADAKVEDWIKNIEGAYKQNQAFGVNTPVNSEQKNVIDAVNGYYPVLQRADKREEEIVKLAEYSHEVLNRDLAVEDWKTEIRNRIKDGGRWTTSNHVEHTPEQSAAVLYANTQFIAWAIEDRTEGLKGKDKRAEIVRVLAEEMVEVKFSGSVKNWVSKIQDSYEGNREFKVAGDLSAEQKNVVDVVNNYFEILHTEEKKENKKQKKPVGGVKNKKKHPVKLAFKKVGQFLKNNWWKIALVAAAVTFATTVSVKALGSENQGNVPATPDPDKKPDGSANTNVTMEVDMNALRTSLNDITGANVSRVVANAENGQMQVYGETEDKSELYVFNTVDSGNDGKVTQADIDALRTADYIVAESAGTVIGADYADSFKNFEDTYFSVGKPDANGYIDVDKYVVSDEYVLEETSSCKVNPTKYASDNNAKAKAITVSYNVADYNGYQFYDAKATSTVVNNSVGVSGVNEVEKGPELG